MKKRKQLTTVFATSFVLSACSPETEPQVQTITTERAVALGCETFRVYAQNRWQPYGTAVRAEPDVLSNKIASFAPNEAIAVNGWFDSGEPIYPTNTPPWDSSIWFHIDYGNLDGWVSFPGVRAAPTNPDETGLSEYGGEPVAILPQCEIIP